MIQPRDADLSNGSRRVRVRIHAIGCRVEEVSTPSERTEMNLGCTDNQASHSNRGSLLWKRFAPLPSHDFRTALGAAYRGHP